MKTGTLDPALEQRGQAILGEIIEHQTRHIGCA